MNIVLPKKAWDELTYNLTHPACHEMKTNITVEHTDDGKAIVSSECIDEDEIVKALKRKGINYGIYN